MIGRALRAEIESYAVVVRRSNPLYTGAAGGTLTADHLAFYLKNVHYLIRHTPIYLRRARDRARSNGDERLALHYANKLGEEAGHDEWAAADLERISRTTQMPVAEDVAPSIRELVAWLAIMIDEDPTLYLAYILFTEHLVVVLGMDWLDHLERRCGIPKSSMSVVANHAELDRDHVEEALDRIDDLVGDPTKLPALRGALRTSISFFDRFCDEVTTLHTADKGDDRAHVSAA